MLIINSQIYIFIYVVMYVYIYIWLNLLVLSGVMGVEMRLVTLFVCGKQLWFIQKWITQDSLPPIFPPPRQPLLCYQGVGPSPPNYIHPIYNNSFQSRVTITITWEPFITWELRINFVINAQYLIWFAQIFSASQNDTLSCAK